MKKSHAPIGVFDSGVGGLTVVKELRKLLPQEDILYFGDTARAPYGPRPPEEILRFMYEVLAYFTQRQIKLAVVACNTMTTLGLEQARRDHAFPLVGVNSGVSQALAASRNGNVGIIATQATVASGKHAAAVLEQSAQSARPHPQACPDFVPLIEAGHFNDELLATAAEQYVAPLQEAGVDVLILGCTHYPCAREVLEKILGPTVLLVDPACETAKETAAVLRDLELLAPEERRGKVELYFSGDPERAAQVGIRILDEVPAAVVRLRLPLEEN